MTRGHHAAGAGEHADPESATDLHSETEVAPEPGDAAESRFERGRVAQDELFGRSGGGTSRPLLALAVVGALVIGAAAGAYFWNGRVERAHTEAARAQVSLGATLALTDNPTEDNPFEVTYTNFGPYPVTIGRVKLDEFALVATAASTDVEIAPSKTARQKLSIKADCTAAGNPETWTPATTGTVAVVTADGVDRTAKVDLGGGPVGGDPRDSPLSYLVQSACGWKYLTFGNLNSYVESAETKGDAVVSHVVLFNPYDNSDSLAPPSPGEWFGFGLDSLTAGVGDAYAVSTEFPLPAAIESDGRFDVIWKVADCARAQQAIPDDMVLHVHGSVGKSPGALVVGGPYSSLVAQLVRLAFTTCGPPGS